MSVKSVMSKVGSFINKYGDEAATTARALTAILDGLALNSSDAAKVREAINKLEIAAEAIANSKTNYNVTIEKKDIIESINAWMDKNAAKIITDAVAKGIK